MKINAEWNSYDEMYSYCLQIVGGTQPAGKVAPETAPAAGQGKVKALTEAKKETKEDDKPAVIEKPAGEKTTLDLIKETGVRLSEKRMDGVRKLLTKFKVGKFAELKTDEQASFLDFITKMEKADDEKYAKMLTSLSK